MFIDSKHYCYYLGKHYHGPYGGKISLHWLEKKLFY